MPMAISIVLHVSDPLGRSLYTIHILEPILHDGHNATNLSIRLLIQDGMCHCALGDCRWLGLQ